MTKRDFIKQTSVYSLGSFSVIDAIIKAFRNHTATKDLVRDEAFWAEIRQDYVLKNEYINLENGYYCITPTPILEAQIQHIRYVNIEGSYYMRKKYEEGHLEARDAMATFLNVVPETVALTRNTTESMDIVISGFPWKEGDEALMAHQEYGSMLAQFDMIQKQKKIVLKKIDIPLHPQSNEEIVSLYENAITPKTKLILVSHIVNITGQIMPIADICTMAHKYGVEVLVDGAHAIGHFTFDLQSLGCDYYGASLHKWLSVPLGSGVLYVNKKHISKLTPIFNGWKTDLDDILRLTHKGTYPVHVEMTIQDAIQYYKALGGKLKMERLAYLKSLWLEALKTNEKCLINTPLDAKRSCGIGNIGVKGIAPHALAEMLLNDYKIWTVAIDGVGVHGCRITPNIYTSADDMVTFVSAIENITSRI